MDIKKRLGWKRGLPQKHQFLYYPQRGFAAAQPTTVDLTPGCPIIYDQGNLGSCTANAGGALAQFVMKKLGLKDFIPSRLCIYYWERLLEGTVNQDSGASLTDCMKVLSQYGCPMESHWKYDVRKFRVAPGPVVTKEGADHRMKAGLSVRQQLVDLKSVLVEGYPFIFGFSVFSSFESQTVARSGIMPMPKRGEELLGGHAVMAVGYDDNKRMFKVRNSWGTGWGQKGYFWMPYTFITDNDFADDFWTAYEFATFK